jgi:hypothetical protein
MLPKIGNEGRGESACTAPQGITGGQPASHPLVVVELDMAVRDVASQAPNFVDNLKAASSSVRRSVRDEVWAGSGLEGRAKARAGGQSQNHRGGYIELQARPPLNQPLVLSESSLLRP